VPRSLTDWPRCASLPPSLPGCCLRAPPTHRENPTLTERVYEDTVPVTAYTRLASLWDVGNRFVARLDNSESGAVHLISSACSGQNGSGAF
jgi:hypothetical protein